MKGSKVKVIRALNAVTEKSATSSEREGLRIQTSYTDGVYDDRITDLDFEEHGGF